jgi:hypothetical protein
MMRRSQAEKIEIIHLVEHSELSISRTLEELDVQELAVEMELTTDQVHNVIDDIKRKKRTTQYLRSAVLSYE